MDLGEEEDHRGSWGPVRGHSQLVPWVLWWKCNPPALKDLKFVVEVFWVWVSS